MASAGSHFHVSGGALDPATVTSLPAVLRHEVYVAISYAIQGVFVWVVPAAAAIFLVAIFIKEVPLRGRAPSTENTAPEAELVG